MKASMGSKMEMRNLQQPQKWKDDSYIAYSTNLKNVGA